MSYYFLYRNILTFVKYIILIKLSKKFIDHRFGARRYASALRSQSAEIRKQAIWQPRLQRIICLQRRLPETPFLENTGRRAWAELSVFGLPTHFQPHGPFPPDHGQTSSFRRWSGRHYGMRDWNGQANAV